MYSHVFGSQYGGHSTCQNLLANHQHSIIDNPSATVLRFHVRFDHLAEATILADNIIMLEKDKI